jgi:hypothetical protein
MFYIVIISLIVGFLGGAYSVYFTMNNNQE